MSPNQNKSQKNSYFMNLALQQARINLGNTKLNPSVGCVIVKNDHLISAGCTSKNGAHAEQNAITSSKTSLINSTLYVTLEPCVHYGKTPPCTNNIIKKKIRKVYFSIEDADPRSFRKCKNILDKKNIYVQNGLLSKKIKDFYRSYYKSRQMSLPFVTSKIAISKDFYSVDTKNKWITNIYSRGRVHLLRAQHDCIITSSKTINRDDPELTCRIKGLEKSSPIRIILDKNLRININSKLVKNSLKHKSLVFYNHGNYKKIKLLKRYKMALFKVKLNSYGDLNLREILIKIKKKGYSRIFLEAGLKLNQNFIKENLIDDFFIFISNKRISNSGRKSFKKCLSSFIFSNKKTIESVNLFGDRLLKYKLK